uniref:Uncharacterized protein n=1 Tax=Anopheles christyi TaxID=43041 RepID=A0A182K5C7_9DIPT
MDSPHPLCSDNPNYFNEDAASGPVAEPPELEQKRHRFYHLKRLVTYSKLKRTATIADGRAGDYGTSPPIPSPPTRGATGTIFRYRSNSASCTGGPILMEDGATRAPPPAASTPPDLSLSFA